LQRSTASMSSDPMLMNGGRTGGQWMSTFEYRADMRDLALDGRHWRAQFGGSSGSGPKMGGYVLCGPSMYVFFRLTMALSVFALFYAELLNEDSSTLGLSSKWYLYVEHWTLLVALAYFGLAFLLTLFAVCAEGKEASTPPLLVIVCWTCYGVLVPASLGCALMWTFVTQSAGEWITYRGSDQSGFLTPVGTFLLVFLDLYVNRQPYYATFHGFCGILFCWGYLLFNILYTAVAGGTDEHGNNYVYRQLNWAQYMSAGKLLMLEIFVLLPYFNALYWSVVWARRRARVIAKHSAV